jgi:hypothetical protein
MSAELQRSGEAPEDLADGTVLNEAPLLRLLGGGFARPQAAPSGAGGIPSCQNTETVVRPSSRFASQKAAEILAVCVYPASPPPAAPGLECPKHRTASHRRASSANIRADAGA